MKKIAFALLFLLSSIISRAEHIIGYDMSLTNLAGTDNYLFRLRLYRENSGVAVMPNNLNVVVYSKTSPNNSVFTMNTVRVSKYISSPNPNDCYASFSSNKLEVGVFEYSINSTQAMLLNNPDGYFLRGSDGCCRASSMNVNDNISGFLLTMDLPRLDTFSAFRRNSSPVITKTPHANFVVGKTYTIDWSATDADGDSLVYVLTPVLSGLDGSPPFTDLEYYPGYKLDSNIADGAPDFNINKFTGLGTYKPTKTGVYALAMRIEEYRNGIKIGETRREIFFSTTIVPEFPPVIADQTNSTNDIVDFIDFAGVDSINYSIQFKASDSPSDSLFMYILPRVGGSQPMNVLDPNLYKATWGYVGSAPSQDLVLKGKGSVMGEFKWTIFPEMGSDLPFEFDIVARDQTCQGALVDSFKVKIFVPYTECYEEKIVNLVGCDSVLGVDNKWYHQSGIYYDTTSVFAKCDTSYMQLVTIHQSPTKKIISGDTNPVLSYQYTYTFERENQNACTWLVENATLLYEDDSVAAIQFDTVALVNVTVIEWDNTTNCGTTNRIELDVRSLGLNINKESLIEIFPNPSLSVIYVRGLNIDNHLINIYTIEGKLLKSEYLNSEGAIDISTLPQGVFLLELNGIYNRINKL